MISLQGAVSRLKENTTSIYPTFVNKKGAVLKKSIIGNPFAYMNMLQYPLKDYVKFICRRIAAGYSEPTVCEPSKSAHFI